VTKTVISLFSSSPPFFLSLFFLLFLLLFRDLETFEKNGAGCLFCLPLLFSFPPLFSVLSPIEWRLKPQSSFSLPFPLFPPCTPLSLLLTGAARRVKVEVERVKNRSALPSFFLPPFSAHFSAHFSFLGRWCCWVPLPFFLLPIPFFFFRGRIIAIRVSTGVAFFPPPFFPFFFLPPSGPSFLTFPLPPLSKNGRLKKE